MLSLGVLAPAAVPLLVATCFAPVHWLGLAARARVGAKVRRTRAALEREGWRIRHSLNWQRPLRHRQRRDRPDWTGLRNRDEIPPATRQNISRSSPAWQSRCRQDDGGGAPTARSLSYASPTRARSTTSKTACSSSPAASCCPRCAPRPGCRQHHLPHAEHRQGPAGRRMNHSGR